MSLWLLLLGLQKMVALAAGTPLDPHFQIQVLQMRRMIWRFAVQFRFLGQLSQLMEDFDKRARKKLRWSLAVDSGRIVVHL